MNEMNEIGAGEEPPLFLPHPRSWHRQARIRGRGSFFPLFFLFVSSDVTFLGAYISTLSWDRPGRKATGSLQRAATMRTADRKRTAHNHAMI